MNVTLKTGFFKRPGFVLAHIQSLSLPDRNLTIKNKTPMCL